MLTVNANTDADKVPIRTPEELAEGQVTKQSPITLELEDDELLSVLKTRRKASRDWYRDKKDLYNRRKKLKNYYFGNQLDKDKLKDYQAAYIDNIIWESINTAKPIAMSRMPDMIVKPGNESELSKKLATMVTDVVNHDLKKRENRTVLGIAYKHRPIYFQGVIKIVWNPQRGEHGDYEFLLINPDRITVDHTATTNEGNTMDFVSEDVEKSVQDILMEFPDKEDEFWGELSKKGILKSEEDKTKKSFLASKITIQEMWFTWYNTAEDEQGTKKFERIEGVCWRFEDCVLGKSKHPYWDWEGERRLFSYQDNEERPLSIEEYKATVLANMYPELGYQEALSKQIFRNHLNEPEKPYIFLNYEQWGEMPLDETSEVEQVIEMQNNINKRGRQITEMNDRARGKHVFSTESGLKKKDVQAMDMDDPDEDLLVKGDVSKVHAYIRGEAAPAQLYKEQEQERQKGFAKMGTNSTTRGQKESDVATTNQILREADYGRIDDVVEETINYAAEKMANWAMQMIKLFYTKDHMRRILGKDGDVTFARINRDSIEDGMEVQVSASGVDKLQRKREAFERAKMKLTDPLSFFEDTDTPDPVGRTERLMLYMTAPQLYLQKFVKKRDITEMAAALMQQPLGWNGGLPANMLPEGAMMGGGQMTPQVSPQAPMPGGGQPQPQPAQAPGANNLQSNPGGGL